jgi:hypothetical protein
LETSLSSSNTERERERERETNKNKKQKKEIEDFQRPVFQEQHAGERTENGGTKLPALQRTPETAQSSTESNANGEDEQRKASQPTHPPAIRSKDDEQANSVALPHRENQTGHREKPPTKQRTEHEEQEGREGIRTR